MSKLISNFKKAFKNNKTGSIVFIVSTLIVGFLIFMVLHDFALSLEMYWVFEISDSVILTIITWLIISTILFWISRFAPFLKWFWFPDQDNTPPIQKEKTAGKTMAESNLKDEITGIIKTYNSSKHLPVDEDGYAIPRPLPKGARIDEAYEARMTLSIPAARKWWFWLPFVTLGVLLFFVAIPLGGYFGYVEAKWVGNRVANAWFNPFPLIVFIAATVLITWWVWKWVYPRLTFTIRKESITVNGVKYRPELSDGLRIGYKMEATPDAALQSGLISGEAKGAGFKTLRYTYGAWGEDLPFAVNSYHAEEYVIWVNNMIKQFNAPAPKDNAPEQGRKKSEF